MGTFLVNHTFMRLVQPLPDGRRTVEVVKSEEKGSDVNLAAYLLTDAFDRDYDVAVVVTNDSDFLEPIRLVRERFDLPVVLLNPGRQPNPKLLQVVSSCKRIRPGLLQASQFPDVILSEHGSPITKLLTW